MMGRYGRLRILECTILGTAIIALALNGPVASAPVAKILRYNLDADHYPRDIGKTFNQLAPNIFATLTRIDPSGKTIPGAAEAWAVSTDARTFTFRLRRTMKWSDGTPLTAHDFEFGWKRAVDPATKSARAWQLYQIVGAEEFHTGKGPREAVAVRAVDDYTFQVKTNLPAPFLPGYVAAHPVFFAQPRHVIQRLGDNWVRVENTVFSGPFRVTRHVPNSVTVLERNPAWPLTPPKVDRIEVYVVPSEVTVLAKYQAGELDFAWGIPLGEVRALRQDASTGKEFIVLPEWRVMSLQLNTRQSPLNNVKVRQAILHAINQRSLTSGPFRGVFQPAWSFRTKNFPGGSPDYLKDVYDRVKARALLAEAGFPNARGFPELTIAVSGVESLTIAAEFLQYQLRDVLNIPVKISILDATSFAQLANEGRHQMMLFAQFALAPDLFDLYARVQGQAELNLGWKDERFSALLDKAQVEKEPKARLELYNQAERYVLLDQVVMIPLWVTDAPSLVKPYVRGIREDQRTRFLHTWEYVDIARP